MKALITFFASTFLLISTSAIADNCDQAAYFYEKGQFKSARTILRPLVKKGEACAEYYMGIMYEESSGMKASKKTKKKNRKKGIKLIQSAKKKGYPAAIKFMNSYH